MHCLCGSGFLCHRSTDSALGSISIQLTSSSGSASPWPLHRRLFFISTRTLPSSLAESTYIGAPVGISIRIIPSQFSPSGPPLVAVNGTPAGLLTTMFWLTCLGQPTLSSSPTVLPSTSAFLISFRLRTKDISSRIS